LILYLAAKYRLPTFQGDVKTAFLKGVMEEEVFTELPEGMNVDGFEEGMVLPMLRTLYGTKQASRQWQKMLRSALEDLGFRNTEADPCIFIKRPTPDKFIILVAYVDDIFGTSNDPELITWFNENISKRFEYSNLGEINKLLGTWVERDKNGDITVTARPAIQKILDQYNLAACKPAPSPAQPGRKLYPARPGEQLLSPEKHADYQALVGSLLFLAVSCRPDITESVNEVSRFVALPTEQHWQAAIRILKYLSGTMDEGLVYTATHNMGDAIDIELVGYSDSSWADSSDRKSTSGLTLQLMAKGEQADGITGNVLSYYSKRQACVALSSTEAEYIAISKAAQTLTWTRRLLHQLGFGDRDPTTLFEDNTSCIAIAESEGLSSRTKHIDVRYHYIRETVASGIIDIQHISTDVMLADFFTKALPVHRFLELKRRLIR
jgi:Reverse transcriptase (RNA-dependent DNA polymerase)